jgi:hypothetical protein
MSAPDSFASPALAPPKKLVLRFVIRLALNAIERLPTVFPVKSLPQLPELRCRLSWEPESCDEEKELLVDDVLRFRIRPF